MEKQLILNDDSTAVMGFPFDAVLNPQQDSIGSWGMFNRSPPSVLHSES